MTTLLIFHLIGAAASLAIVLLAAWRLYRSQGGYELPAKLLPTAAVYQLVTGIGLVVTGGSLTQFCLSGGVYLAVIWVTQRLLKKRLAFSRITG